MPEPEAEEIRFPCIGCGAMNPMAAETCGGCGHPFHEPTPALPPPRARPTNPYDPPKAPVARPPSFRIGSAMLVIAVVAVALGAFAQDPYLGAFVSIGLLPATIRTIFKARWRGAEGRPMGLGEQALTFVMTLGALIVVSTSSMIAFGMTCFPIGMAVSAGGLPAILIVGVGVGLFAAIVVGTAVTRLFLKVSRAREDRERDKDLIRWQ